MTGRTGGFCIVIVLRSVCAVLPLFLRHFYAVFTPSLCCLHAVWYCECAKKWWFSTAPAMMMTNQQRKLYWRRRCVYTFKCDDFLLENDRFLCWKWLCFIQQEDQVFYYSIITWLHIALLHYYNIERLHYCMISLWRFISIVTPVFILSTNETPQARDQGYLC